MHREATAPLLSARYPRIDSVILLVKSNSIASAIALLFVAVFSTLFNTYRVGSGRRMRRLKPRKAATLSVDTAIRLFNQGDAKAFEFIYRSYCDFVHRICLRMLRDPAEAEDAAQDVFICVFCKIHTFRGESKFSSWLYRLTTNSVLMRFRRNKHKHQWIPLEEHKEDGRGSSCNEISSPDLNPSGLLDRIDIQSAVDVLPNGYKAAFLLHDIHGYDHREIAEMSGYSIGNSKSQLHKARLRLRKFLGGMHKKEVQQDARLKPVCVN
jgi:RNA polymerase sigma-70 factor (ECF subfamily)